MEFGKRKKKLSTVGRRTGVDVVADKKIKLQENGFEDFNGYWTPSECSSISGLSPDNPIHSSPKTSNVQRISSFIKGLPNSDKHDVHKNITFNNELNSTNFISSGVSWKSNSSIRNHNIVRKSNLDNTIVEGKTNSLAVKKTSKNLKLYSKGRRTGVDMFTGKSIKVNNGIEDYAGYWTDTPSETVVHNVCDSTPSESTSKSRLLTQNRAIQTNHNLSINFQCPAVSSTMTTPTKSCGPIRYNSPKQNESETVVGNVSPNHDSSMRKRSLKCKSPVPLKKGSLKDKYSVSLKKWSPKNKSPISSENESSKCKTPVFLQKTSLKDKSLISENLLSTFNKPETMEKMKISNSSQHISNPHSDASTSAIPLCLSNSNNQVNLPSRLEQTYNTPEKGLILYRSKFRSKKSMQISTNSGRNKIVKFQQSSNPNLPAISISNEESKDLNLQQDKTVPIETNLTMPKSRNGKKIKTTLSRNATEADIKISNIQSEPSCRRSSRPKVSVLEYWRNERRQFNYKTDQVLLEKGGADLISERLCNKYTRKHKRSDPVKIKAKLSDNSVNLNHIQNTIDKIAVTNPNTGEDEYVYLHRPYSTLLWSSPQTHDPNNSSYQVTKCISGEFISFGYIEINVKKKKEAQYSPTHNITFNIVKGQVRVTVNKTKINLSELDTITIPISNIYSIHNIGNIKAVLFFCIFKAPLFDYQVSTSHL